MLSGYEGTVERRTSQRFQHGHRRHNHDHKIRQLYEYFLQTTDVRF